MSLRCSRYLAFVFAIGLGIGEAAINWGHWQYAPLWIVDYIIVGWLLWAFFRTRSGGHVHTLLGGWAFTAGIFYMALFVSLDPKIPDHMRAGVVLLVLISLMLGLSIIGFLCALLTIHAQQRVGGNTMMKKPPLAIIALLLCLSLATTTDLVAQEPLDGRHRIFRDDLLDNLVGNWRLTRKIRGQTVENSVKADWVLSHQFLQIHMKDMSSPPAYEAMVFIGYDNTSERYGIGWTCSAVGFPRH